MKTRIYYEDTDANEIVYHANYIKYCDRARTEYFFQNNVSLKNKNEFLVIRGLDAKYYLPARLGDILDVSNKIEKIQEASVGVFHEITNQNGQRVFTMKITLVFLKNGKPSRLPKEFIDLFNKFNASRETV